SVHTPLPHPVASFSSAVAHLHLHSFPTRRSSDLPSPTWIEAILLVRLIVSPSLISSEEPSNTTPTLSSSKFKTIPFRPFSNSTNSPDHTSELQSRENLVCRLLLEKKNDNT